MTTTRDPDRLLRAWLDLMPDEAPDRAIAAVLQATETTRQVRALPRVGRWRIRMNRLTLIATAAIVIAALVGGAYLLAGGPQGPVLASPTAPAATVGPTATASAAIAAPPELIWGDWAADIEPIPSFGQPAARIQLSIDWDKGIKVWVQRSALDDCCNGFSSSSLAAGPKELRVRANVGVLGCERGQEGTYTWSRSTDGLFLTLTLVQDACANRAAMFARTWVHSLGAVNDGGPGVAYGVTPMVQLTMPLGVRYAAGGGEQSQDIHTFNDGEPFRSFVVVRNPGGFDAPCSTTDTKKSDLAHTMAAFTTYLKGLPGATVATSATTIGGKPAVRLAVSIAGGTKCASGSIKWLHVQSLTDTADWALTAGQAQAVYIVQMDPTTTFLLWYEGTPAEERTVLDSIKFIDTLPTP